MNINISGEVVRTSQLPKRIIGLGDYLVALNSSPLETSTVLVSDFVSFLNTQFATSLASLTDVSINGPLPGQALVFNGSYWVNQGIGELDTLDSVTTRGNTTTNSITVGGLYSPYLRLDTVATPTLQAGMFAWNDVDGTANLRLKGNNVTLQIGQETVARVVNKTGADLLESEYKVVRVRVASEGGAQGQRLAVVLAQGDNDPDSATTLGVVTENIGNNQEGFITIFGNVNGINTTGSLQGETWVDGDVLYLSPTTPGGLTKVKPQAPQHTLIVGYVVYAHQNNGKIFVKVDNGYELDELHNVLISNPNNNDILQYNSTQQVWKNIAASVAVPIPTLAQVTTAGNTTTNSIGIGTTGPVDFNLVVEGIMQIRNAASSFTGLRIDSASIRKRDTGTFSLGTNDTTSFNIFAPTNNIGINTTTDSGYKLDVNGSARVQGNSLIKGSDDTNQNFALQITNLSGTTKFQVGNGSQNVRFDQWQPLGGGSSVSWTPGGGISLGVGSNTSNQTYTGITYGGGQSGSSTTGSYTSLNLTPAINQTGASGATTRGIYINPTLTFAYDFRAIETVRGNVVFGSTSGNVLIGTTTDAGYKLDVNGTGRFSGNLEVNAGNNGQIFINNVYPRLLFGKTGTPSWSMFADTENSGQFEIGTGAGFPYNTFTSRIHISSAGNVGIGITPIYKLDVNGSVRFQSTGTTSVTHSFLFRNDNSAYGGFTIGSSGQSLSIQQNSGYGYLSAAGFNFGSTNSNIWTNNGSVLDIQNAAGSTTYLRIANTTGNVLIGTTTDAGYKLHVNGTTYSNNYVGNSLQIYGQGQIFSGSAFQLFNTANNSKAGIQYINEYGLNIGINSENLSGVTRLVTIGGNTVASANNDVLVGLDINPTYTLGAFTGTQRHGVRIQNSRLYITGSYSALSSEALNPDSLVHIDATINGRGGSRAIAVRINPTININGAGSQTFAALEVKPTFTNNTNNSTELAINTDGPNFLGGVNTLGWWTYWPGQGGSSTYHIVNAPNGQGFRVQINSNIAGYSYEFNGSGIPTYTLRNNNIDALKVYSTGNVGINTSTDAGYKLDVNGSQRILGNLTITAGGSGTNTFNANVNYLFANQNNVYGLVDLQNAAGQGVFLKVTGTPTAGTGFDYFWISGTTTSSTVGTTRNIFNVNPTYNLTGAFTGTMRGFYYNPVLTSMTGATHRAIETTSGDVIFNGGQVGIGTTSPTGRNGYGGGTVLEIVDNNVYASFNLNGGSAGSPTYLTFGAQGAGADIRVNNKSLQFAVNSIDALKIATTGNVLINTVTDAGYKLDVNGTTRVNNIFYVTNSAYTGNLRIEAFGNNQQRIVGAYGENITWAAGGGNTMHLNAGEVYVSNSFLGPNFWIHQNASFCLGQQAYPDASALLDIRSTTKGFLAPRLTTAQILAITSPAEGLQVYNTDLKTICFYNGTAWQRVTSTAM